MAVGLASGTVDNILHVFSGTSSYTSIATVYMQLHTNVGDPGAAGTSNISAVTTRNPITWGALSSHTLPMSSIAGYSMTATETIAYVSFWTAATSGTFLQSAALTTPQPVINGSTLNFTSIVLSYTPIAA